MAQVPQEQSTTRSSLSRIPTFASSPSGLPRPPSASQNSLPGLESGQTSASGTPRLHERYLAPTSSQLQRRLSSGSGSSVASVNSTPLTQSGRGRQQPSPGPSSNVLRRSFIPSQTGPSLQARTSLTVSRTPPDSGSLEPQPLTSPPSPAHSLSHCSPPHSSILSSPAVTQLTQQATLSRQQAAGHTAPQQHNSKGQAASILVAVRLRPMSDKERARGDHETWTTDEHQNVGFWKAGKWHPKFHYDHVFGPQARNLQLFQTLARPLITPALQGISGTVFAYGVTSSGKTHTMMGAGPVSADDATGMEPGLVPLTIQELFTQVQAANQAAAQDTSGAGLLTYSVKLSMMEIYNEVLNDLLEPSMTNLRLREDGNKGVVVENLSEELVTSAEQALACISRGDAYRKVSSTAYNEDSSRSHTIVRLTVEGSQRGSGDRSTPRTTGGGNGARTSAVLSLIDLAGSESAKVSVNKGQRMEGSFINKSLLTLGTVINKLAVGGGKANSSMHIPFRDSKLTRLLQNSLTGHGARISIVCNITPAAAQFEETTNTLKFASRAKLVRLSVTAQQTMDSRSLLLQYRHELRELRAQLAAVMESQSGGHAPHPGLLGADSSDASASEAGEDSESDSLRVQLLKAQLSSAMTMLTAEREARQKAEQQAEHLEDRLHGMTRLLESRSHGGGTWQLGPAGKVHANGKAESGRHSYHASGPTLSSSGIPDQSAIPTAPQTPGCNTTASMSAAGHLRITLPPTPLPSSGGAAEDAVRLPSCHSTGSLPEATRTGSKDLQAHSISPRSCIPSVSNGDQSPGSPFAPTDSSMYDPDTDAALLEQINELQDELIGAGLPVPTSLGSLYESSALTSSKLPSPNNQIGKVSGLPPMTTQTSGPPRSVASGSIFGDGDKDLEIQVLLADREVLQDQVLSVELDNERLAAENEVLVAEAARLRLEHEKVRRINKELESDMAAMRDFKNQLATQLEAMRQLEALKTSLQMSNTSGASGIEQAPSANLLPSKTIVSGLRDATAALKDDLEKGTLTRAVDIVNRVQALEQQAQTVLVHMLAKNQQLEAKLGVEPRYAA